MSSRWNYSVPLFFCFTNATLIVGVIPTDDDRFLCRKCGKKYAGKQLVLSHILFECGVQPVIQCPLCPRKCKRNDVLQTHLKNIHGIH
ncbi:hypothetical protein GWI33_012763 [Rhynchophorus ferrugineus]|uniref:C2H2-type domain-containing protein n=1 Tax=Rhynchophorus ferrugineus TaxID=354439 RepID=A0A834J1B9_RHYFE|nr:hypothetical protein GWI33_012763 [Rhynchophorus ferrugineus]